MALIQTAQYSTWPTHEPREAGRQLRRSLIAISLAIDLAASFSSRCDAQVPEIANPSLPDIARVIPTPRGPVIEYNPIHCSQLGPLVCTFFRLHEYGHVHLGHGYRPQWPQAVEAEADCWAASNGDPASVQAAYQFFLMGGGSTPIHCIGPCRAARLKQCAPFPLYP